jgi:hypothetical protein
VNCGPRRATRVAVDNPEPRRPEHVAAAAALRRRAAVASVTLIFMLSRRVEVKPPTIAATIAY